MTAMTRGEYQKRPGAREYSDALHQQEHIRGLEMLSQAAVKADVLTGHSAWDTYLSYLQDFVEQAKAGQAEFESKLNDPMLVDHSQMLQAKIAGRECAAIVMALTTAMELPKDIMANGDKARDMIARMKEKTDNEAA